MGTTTERERLGAELRARYEDGASIRELARECGRSPGFVRRLLVRGGTQIGSDEHWDARIAMLVREGRMYPAELPKTPVGPPLVPLKDGTPLSEIVIAHRGGA